MEVTWKMIQSREGVHERVGTKKRAQAGLETRGPVPEFHQTDSVCRPADTNGLEAQRPAGGRVFHLSEGSVRQDPQGTQATAALPLTAGVEAHRELSQDRDYHSFLAVPLQYAAGHPHQRSRGAFLQGVLLDG